MEILARYVHGSADSRDLDVIYLVEDLPSFRDCQAFCCADAAENRNLCTVRDGVIERCFKGQPDEVNNALIATWSLHEQDCPLLLTRAVERDRVVKYLAVLRKTLMMLRHTQYKTAARQALRGPYARRAALLESVDLGALRWAIPEAQVREEWKRTAFQLGQAVLLGAGVEVYTKGALAEHLPALRPCLERRPCDPEGVSEVKGAFLRLLAEQDITDEENLIVRVRDGKRVRHISIRGKEQELEVLPWNL